MNFFLKTLSNPVINIAVMAWFLAQLIKFLIVLLTSKKFDFSRFVGSGGMPSSHSALVCSATTAVLLMEGYRSSLFAIALTSSLVIMYDAAGIRRAAGEQAKILNHLINEWNSISDDEKQSDLKELLGHTKLEVFAGATLGVAVAYAYYTYIIL